MANLKEGMKAPEFDLPSSAGKNISLKEFQGKKRVVLYFYPKDNTPGCTVEACSFRDQMRQIEKKDAVVLGVSPDGSESHQKFIKKFKLPFTLLSDEEKKMLKDYGMWVKKKFLGREYMGVARQTIVIGKDGVIEKVYEKVKPKGHAEEILEFLKSRPS